MIGTVGRLVVLRVFGNVFDGPIDWLRDLITENRLLFFVISVVLVLISLWADRKAGGGEVDGLLHMDEEIKEMEAEDRSPADD